MKCANCGRELRLGSIYCEYCGKENQIVPDYSLIEDTEFQEQQKEEHLEQQRKLREQKEQEDKKRKEQRRKLLRKRMLILCGVVMMIALICGVMFSLNRYHVTQTYAYQYQAASTYLYAQDYEKAIECATKAVGFDSYVIDGWYVLAQAYIGAGDVTSAIETLEDATSVAGISQSEYTISDAYTLLIGLYDQEDQYDAILLLAQTTTDETVLAICEEYLVSEPHFSLKSGSYEGDIVIELTSSDDSCTIYYTTDGSVPDENSTEYEEAISLEAGTTVISAVCIDGNGHSSLTVSNEYEIAYSAPSAPYVSPASGTYDYQASITVEVPDGCTAYYTWDGTTPDTHSSKYSGAIEMPEGNSLFTVILYDTHGLSSKTVTRNYVYIPEDDE